MEQKTNCWIFFGWNDNNEDYNNNAADAAHAAHAALHITYDIFFLFLILFFNLI